MANIGFIIISHNNPAQMRRLTSVLEELYEPAAIVCHHDFGRSRMHLGSFAKSVKFVVPHFPTAWGTISIVLAGLSALTLLYRLADPDWFVMLSGSDYPVKDPRAVLAELYEGHCDAFLDHREIKYSPPCQAPRTVVNSYAQPEWSQLAYNRYVAANPYADGSQSPLFSLAFRCFAGDQWLTGNRCVARVLISAASVESPIFRYFSRRPVPDEAVYHTILCNEPTVRVCPNNHRYADWSAGGHHPKDLGTEDLSTILQSGAHFARKFRDGTQIVDELDKFLAVSSGAHAKKLSVVLK